jgi:hypothetical protein
MGSVQYLYPCDKDRHALREFKGALDRMRDDLAFEIVQAIRDEGDSSAAARNARRLFEDQDWMLRWEWCALLLKLQCNLDCRPQQPIK